MKTFKECIKEASLASLMRSAERVQTKKEPEVYNKPRLKVINTPIWKQLGGKSLNYIFEYKGKWFITTTHGYERFEERNKLSATQLKKFFSNIIDSSLEQDISPGEYLFYSKSLNQAIAIDYRPDKSGEVKGNQFVIITMLPHGKQDIQKNDSGKTKKIILESYYDDYSSKFIKYIDYLMTEHCKNELLAEEKQYGYNIKNLVFENCTVEVILCENKFYHLKNFEIIEVE